MQSKELFIHRLRPIHRGLIALVLAIVVFFVFPRNENIMVQLLYSWLAFSLTYLLIAWATFYTMPIQKIIKLATIEDGSRIVVTLFILLASFTCLFAVLFVIESPADNPSLNIRNIGIAVASMIASWALVHTIYTFHYARLYYNDENKKAGGLDFPGSEKPDYLDFAYFSFVMGCTFQVSDVEISNKKIRHVALFHGLLSFALNTFVVALTINIVAGFIK